MLISRQFPIKLHWYVVLWVLQWRDKLQCFMYYIQRWQMFSLYQLWLLHETASNNSGIKTVITKKMDMNILGWISSEDPFQLFITWIPTDLSHIVYWQTIFHLIAPSQIYDRDLLHVCKSCQTREFFISGTPMLTMPRVRHQKFQFYCAKQYHNYNNVKKGSGCV